MALKLKVYTIFPEIFPGFLGFSLTGRALEEGIWSLETVNIRDYALDKHGSVDDTPCGGRRRDGHAGRYTGGAR